MTSTSHRRTPVVAAALLAVLAMIATACTTASTDGLPGVADVSAHAPTATEVGGTSVADRRFLRASTSCEDLLGYYIDGASDLVGPWGLGGQGYFGPTFGVAETAAATDDAQGGAEGTLAAPAPANTVGADGSFSGTNVQEAGVDEPDIAKTDGQIIVTATNGVVSVVDVATSQVVGTIPLSAEAWQNEILLDGTTLLILSTGGSGGGYGPIPIEGDVALVPAFGPTRTTVTRVDVSTPAAPQVLGSVRMEGAYRSARMIDGTVRMVLVSDPTGLAFTQPTDGGLGAEDEAERANQRLLAESDIDDWVPHLQVTGPDGQEGEPQRILDCASVSQPREFAGLSTLSVLTFDLRGTTLEPTSGAGLVAAGDTVYASTRRLIVSTSPWGGWIQPFLGRLDRPDSITTDLHSFDISDPASTQYVGSGSVTGSLINQFALSEADGIIRVATTTQPEWLTDGQAPSQSSLVMLAEQGDALVETGRVDGLGLTERIYAVRYLGPDLAAIVTFRQTDPLYLVDTSDPTAPAVAGELKIPGYSAYLHPLGEGRLLGIGQDAGETGQITGLQVSLFDVSNPAAPSRLSQVVLGEGYTPVEGDHRAFLYWTPTGQAVLPVELYGQGILDETGQEYFAGAVALSVQGDTVAVQGRVANTAPDAGPDQFFGPVQRSLIIGSDLWTLGYDSLARHDLASLQLQQVVRIR